MPYGKAKPVVKLYCLPILNEDRLQILHEMIVRTAVAALPGLKLVGELDLLVLFIPDSMQYGLGSEILVEVDVPMHTGMPAKTTVSAQFGAVVKKFFPDAFVQCTPYPFDPEQSWTS